MDPLMPEEAFQLCEEKDTKIIELLDFMRRNKHCVFFGVAGEKISVDVDMSMNNSTMRSMVIIVGLPYPKNKRAPAGYTPIL